MSHLVQVLHAAFYDFLTQNDEGTIYCTEYLYKFGFVIFVLDALVSDVSEEKVSLKDVQGEFFLTDTCACTSTWYEHCVHEHT